MSFEAKSGLISSLSPHVAARGLGDLATSDSAYMGHRGSRSTPPQKGYQYPSILVDIFKFLTMFGFV